jgi:hypothetical protein
MRHTRGMIQELIDNGRLIEAGWLGLSIMAYPSGMSAGQANELRSVFFAGAQHLFSSIVSVMEPGLEPTDKDLERVDKIVSELTDFINEYEMKIPTMGNA